MPSGRWTSPFPQSVLKMNKAEVKAEPFLDQQTQIFALKGRKKIYL